MIKVKNILTLANWQRVLKHYFRFWWLLLRKVIMFFALLSAACATQPVERHSLDGWDLVYNDFEAMKRICPTQFSKEHGCTDPATKIMYCIKGDYMVCGHELMHITDGAFHYQRRD